MADARRFAHLYDVTIETLRALQEAAVHVRDAARERGNAALVAREEAHIAAIEERIFVLEDHESRRAADRAAREENQG